MILYSLLAKRSRLQGRALTTLVRAVVICTLWVAGDTLAGAQQPAPFAQPGPNGFVANYPVEIQNQLTVSGLKPRFQVRSTASTGSAGISIYHVGWREWLIKTDDGNGDILRMGWGLGNGLPPEITDENIRFHAGVFFGKTLGYIPFASPPETTPEAVFRLLGGTSGTSSFEAYRMVDDPMLLHNYERISILTGTNGGCPLKTHCILSGAHGTGQVRPIGVQMGENTDPIFLWATNGGFTSTSSNPISHTFVGKGSAQLVDIKHTGARDAILRIYNSSSGYMAGLDATDGRFKIASGVRSGFAGTRGIAVDPAGHPQVSSASPSLRGCGAGASVAGNDAVGIISFTAGGATSCTLGFGSAWLGHVVCTANSSSTDVSVAVTALSGTAVTFGFSKAFGAGKLYYACREF